MLQAWTFRLVIDNNKPGIIIRIASNHSASMQVAGQHKLFPRHPLHKRHGLRLPATVQVLLIIGAVLVELVREVSVQVHAFSVVSADVFSKGFAAALLKEWNKGLFYVINKDLSGSRIGKVSLACFLSDHSFALYLIYLVGTT